MGEWVTSVSVGYRDGRGRNIATLDLVAEGRTRGKLRSSIYLQSASESQETGEEPVQLSEDERYRFRVVPLAPDVAIEVASDGKIVFPYPEEPLTGTITTGGAGGLLSVPILFTRWGKTERSPCLLGVRPVKFEPDQFRRMLGDIAEWALDLALSIPGAPSLRLRTSSYTQTRSTLGSLALLQSLLNSEEHRCAIALILRSPRSVLTSSAERQRTNRGIRGAINVGRQFASARVRVPIHSGHSLAAKMSTVPAKLDIRTASESVDTPENRFVKFMLSTYATFFENILRSYSSDSPARAEPILRETRRLLAALRITLANDLFVSVGQLRMMPTASAAMQRSEGYRQLLRGWLRFVSGSSLSWRGGAEVFEAGRRNSDRLYEYWAFLQLIRILSEHFGLPVSAIRRILTRKRGRLHLRLQTGKATAMKWTFSTPGTKAITFRLSYNRTFVPRGFGRAGTWTTALRPDFTLSMWPALLGEDDAEKGEKVRHLHFDAKYRIESADTIFEVRPNQFAKVRREEARGRFRMGDVHKMHAYKDAIRRSVGAFVLYPGWGAAPTMLFRGYHELLPGLGAFALTPRAEAKEPYGRVELTKFLLDAVQLLINPESKLERMLNAVHGVNVQPDS